MSPLHSLTTLLALRNREVTQLQAALAAKDSVRRRYQDLLAQLAMLRRDSGASGQRPLAQAANCAAYKQALLALASTQQADLALHEADMALARDALQAAHAREQALAQVLAARRQVLQQAQRRREHKRDDELAQQVWRPGTAFSQDLSQGEHHDFKRSHL